MAFGYSSGTAAVAHVHAPAGPYSHMGGGGGLYGSNNGGQGYGADSRESSGLPPPVPLSNRQTKMIVREVSKLMQQPSIAKVQRYSYMLTMLNRSHTDDCVNPSAQTGTRMLARFKH